MSKKQVDNGDDGGFFRCVIHVRNHPDLINELLEHPEFSPKLRRICRSITNWADADDLFSDVCVKLPSVIHQFVPSKSDGSFDKWLRRVTRNLFIDQVRRPSLPTESTPSDERFDLRDPGADAEEQLWQRELAKELNRLIAEQQEDSKRLMLTYYFQENLSFREIKDILKTEYDIHTSHVTVRNVVRKLLRQLWQTKISIPDVDRKANKLSKRPVVKAQINRKPAKVSKRRVATRRIALKK